MIDIYARLSRAVDGSTVNVDHQVELGTESIEERGARVGEVFRDNSLSAWNPKVNRASWAELMQRLETGASDGVWVLDATRFSRKPIEGERLIEVAANGTKVWSDAGEYDLTTADGRAAFRSAMTRAAEESDRNSERVKRGKLRRARKGRVHGGIRGYAMPGVGPKPAGWEPGDPRQAESVERVEAEREIVRDAYRRLLGGAISVVQLARELNGRGQDGERAALPVAGGHWTYFTLARSLTRAALAGKLVHKGEDMGALVNVEPVVSQEDWERVCAVMASRKTGRPPAPQHPLSSLIMCECGRSRLLATVRSGRATYEDGSPRREYRCRRREDLPERLRGCGRNVIDARSAEAAVFAAMVERLSDPRSAERLAAHYRQVRAERTRIEADIAQWNEAADRLALKTARWGQDRVDKAMEPILAEIDSLQAELAKLDDEPGNNPAGTAEAVAQWREAVESGDIAAQRTLIKRTFPRIALIRQRGRGDHSPERIKFDGIPQAATE